MSSPLTEVREALEEARALAHLATKRSVATEAAAVVERLDRALARLKEVEPFLAAALAYKQAAVAEATDYDGSPECERAADAAFEAFHREAIKGARLRGGGR